MHRFVFFAFAFLPAFTVGQTAAKIPPPNSFPNEAVVFERSETAIRMHADGTGERVMHVWLRVQSEGAARQFGVLSFSYAAAQETAHITLVRVHKADGTAVDTPATDAIDMAAAVTREAPLYSDLKEKHVPVRSLAAGDTLEYEVHVTIDKPEAPGQFWGIQHFTPPGSVIVLAEGFTLEVPKDKYVQVWSPNHKTATSEHDGLLTYRWEGSQLIPAPKTNTQPDDSADSTPPKDPDEDADGRKLPSVAWTTFHSWAEVGDWYRGLSLDRAQPNDALQARASEITKDAKTPEEQARAIYNYVSTRTRYVGIDFGIGRYQPHTAAEVLANNYGDCKDKDTLLEALLRAKGFHTAPALIGVGLTPIEAVPSPAVFNHVITTIEQPGGRIWLDSTPEVAPYRLLSAPIRDQLALVVPAQGSSGLERTPATPPYPMYARFELTGELSANGTLAGHVTATYRTDYEVALRSVARSVPPSEWDKVGLFSSQLSGFSGTVSHTSITNLDDLSSPLVLHWDYAQSTYGDWPNRRIDPCFPALDFTVPAGDHHAPQTDLPLGLPRTLIAICRIRLPEGYRTDLPDAAHIKSNFASVDKTYRFDGKELVIERTIVVLAPKLPKSEWAQYKTFAKDSGFDGEPWIQLIRPPLSEPPLTQAELTRPHIARGPHSDKATVAANPPVATTAESDSANELIQRASQKIKGGDWAGAAALLDQAKAKDPKAKGLWASYGWIASAHRKYDEAIADYKKDLELDPENWGSAQALATAQAQSGDRTAACQTLQGYLVRYPEHVWLWLYLTGMQSAEGENESALKTLEAAAHANPDNRMIRARQSDILRRLDRKDEAEAAAKSALDETDDMEAINDATYVLAEIDRDLPYAEEASRKGIAALEARTAAIGPSEANNHAFAQANLLFASWDTLGWILFREGKFEQAEPLLLAGWRNSLVAHRGNHLAQLYEAIGKKQEALATYRLAAASIEGTGAQTDVAEHITSSIARLGGNSPSPSGYNSSQALQATRTYHVARPAGVTGWGTFRLQIGADRVIASQQMSGQEKLVAVGAELNTMKFPELVPPGSIAHVLRSAVVSCSMGTSCDVVLVPNSSLQTEQ